MSNPFTRPSFFFHSCHFNLGVKKDPALKMDAEVNGIVHYRRISKLKSVLSVHLLESVIHAFITCSWTIPTLVFLVLLKLLCLDIWLSKTSLLGFSLRRRHINSILTTRSVCKHRKITPLAAHIDSDQFQNITFLYINICMVRLLHIWLNCFFSTTIWVHLGQHIRLFLESLRLIVGPDGRGLFLSVPESCGTHSRG